MTEAAERWSACSIATAAWPRTWRQPADRGVTWRSQGRWRRARPHRRNSETGSQRDAYLASLGYRVLRFWNAEVLKNMNDVLETIFAALASTSPRVRGEVEPARDAP